MVAFLERVIASTVSKTAFLGADDACPPLKMVLYKKFITYSYDLGWSQTFYKIVENDEL
jgi:hypothetical protein